MMSDLTDFDFGENLPDFKKEKSVKEVAVKPSNLPSQNLANWGKKDIRATSIVIPRINKMEMQSDKVKAQTAKFGEFRDSLTDQLYGDLNHPFSIVPFAVKEAWVIYDLIKVKGVIEKNFKEMIAVTADNENWKYHEEKGESEHSKENAIDRDRLMDVYCMIPDEIELLPDDWQARGLKPLPKILSFRRTAMKAGKKLYTQMYIINESKGLPPCATIIEVSGKSKDGPNNSTYVSVDIKPTRLSTERENEIAFIWFQAVMNSKEGDKKVESDDSSLHVTEPADF
jgi:hypothetical protein